MEGMTNFILLTLREWPLEEGNERYDVVEKSKN